jgi:hypothetical protein
VADAQKSISVFDSEIGPKRILLRVVRYLETTRIVPSGVEEKEPGLFSRGRSENLLTNLSLKLVTMFLWIVLKL